MQDRIEQVLDRIRPALMADGGDVELVGVVDGVARLRLVGACCNCSMSTLTVKYGIERMLLTHVPELRAVEAVFD